MEILTHVLAGLAGMIIAGIGFSLSKETGKEDLEYDIAVLRHEITNKDNHIKALQEDVKKAHAQGVTDGKMEIISRAKKLNLGDLTKYSEEVKA